MIAVAGGLVIGLCLGLLGSGGSILTVPLLVYLLDHEPKAAIAESLAIVGGIALVASIRPMLKRDVDWTSLVLFGIPVVLGTVAGVWCSQWISGVVQLVVFSIVMLVAAAMMLRGRRGGDAEKAPTDRTRRDRVILVVEGLVVGALTGIVGVGGGFADSAWQSVKNVLAKRCEEGGLVTIGRASNAACRHHIATR